MRTLLILLLLTLLNTVSVAKDVTEKVPAEILTFTDKGTTILDWKIADLNGDGLDDYLVVLEQDKKLAPDIQETLKRSLLIIIRQKDNSLKLEKRNNLAVACSTCGGRVDDDGFEEIKANKRSFSVKNHTMGTAYQTSDTYSFGYSRRDNTWQLVSVVSTQNRLYEDHEIKNTFTPPHSFGKIDFADFDPDDYTSRGEGYVLRKRQTK